MIICGIDMKSPDLGNINPNATDDEQTANSTLEPYFCSTNNKLVVIFIRWNNGLYGDD